MPVATAAENAVDPSQDGTALAELPATGAEVASADGPPTSSPANEWHTMQTVDISEDVDLAFRISLPDAFAAFASNSEDPKRSALVIEEDGLALAPGNALHKQVREEGMGAFSHWGKLLLFTSSDNTDPRENGRTYRFRIP